MTSRQGTGLHQFTELSRENVYDLMALQIREEESGVIAPNPHWLAEAQLFKEAKTFGIYEADTAVGLLTVIDPRLGAQQDPDCEIANRTLYVWRLMVDRQHRGKGVGTSAINHSIGYAHDIGLEGVMLATDESLGYSAAGFYEKLGFHRTGRIIEGETEFIYSDNAQHE